MTYLSTALLISALAPVALWAQPQESADSELLRADREWAKAAAAGDMEAVFSYWADDAEIYAPGRPPARGLEEIKRLVAMRRSAPGSHISWEPLVALVSASGDLGFTRGTYSMTFPGPGEGLIMTTGTYVSIWRRDGRGNWKCILEIHSPLPDGGPEGPG